ncbi:MAG: hypothetical protein Q7S14_01020, partial [bacterium]|nr:hypothetical protein [bacterium]
MKRGAINFLVLAIFAFITVLVPVTVKLVQQKQETRSKAEWICDRPDSSECMNNGGSLSECCNYVDDGGTCNYPLCGTSPNCQQCEPRENDVPPIICADGQKKCDGTAILVCVNNNWTGPIEECGGSGCFNGSCSITGENLSCPGPTCDQCGRSGWWSTECKNWCGNNDGSYCPANNDPNNLSGPLTPCGDGAKICSDGNPDVDTGCVNGVQTIRKGCKDNCFASVQYLKCGEVGQVASGVGLVNVVTYNAELICKDSPNYITCLDTNKQNLVTFLTGQSEIARQYCAGNSSNEPFEDCYERVFGYIFWGDLTLSSKVTIDPQNGRAIYPAEIIKKYCNGDTGIISVNNRYFSCETGNEISEIVKTCIDNKLTGTIVGPDGYYDCDDGKQRTLSPSLAAACQVDGGLMSWVNCQKIEYDARIRCSGSDDLTCVDYEITQIVAERDYGTKVMSDIDTWCQNNRSDPYDTNVVATCKSDYLTYVTQGFTFENGKVTLRPSAALTDKPRNCSGAFVGIDGLYHDCFDGSQKTLSPSLAAACQVDEGLMSWVNCQKIEYDARIRCSGSDDLSCVDYEITQIRAERDYGTKVIQAELEKIKMFCSDNYGGEYEDCIKIYEPDIYAGKTFDAGKTAYSPEMFKKLFCPANFSGNLTGFDGYYSCDTGEKLALDPVLDAACKTDGGYLDYSSCIGLETQANQECGDRALPSCIKNKLMAIASFSVLEPQRQQVETGKISQLCDEQSGLGGLAKVGCTKYYQQKIADGYNIDLNSKSAVLDKNFVLNYFCQHPGVNPFVTVAGDNNIYNCFAGGAALSLDEKKQYFAKLTIDSICSVATGVQQIAGDKFYNCDEKRELTTSELTNIGNKNGDINCSQLFNKNGNSTHQKMYSDCVAGYVTDALNGKINIEETRVPLVTNCSSDKSGEQVVYTDGSTTKKSCGSGKTCFVDSCIDTNIAEANTNTCQSIGNNNCALNIKRQDIDYRINEFISEIYNSSDPRRMGLFLILKDAGFTPTDLTIDAYNYIVHGGIIKKGNFAVSMTPNYILQVSEKNNIGLQGSKIVFSGEVVPASDKKSSGTTTDLTDLEKILIKRANPSANISLTEGKKYDNISGFEQNFNCFMATNRLCGGDSLEIIPKDWQTNPVSNLLDNLAIPKNSGLAQGINNATSSVSNLYNWSFGVFGQILNGSPNFALISNQNKPVSQTEISFGNGLRGLRDLATGLVDFVAVTPVREYWRVKITDGLTKDTIILASEQNIPKAQAWEILLSQNNIYALVNDVNFRNAIETSGEYVPELGGFVSFRELCNNPALCSKYYNADKIQRVMNENVLATEAIFTAAKNFGLWTVTQGAGGTAAKVAEASAAETAAIPIWRQVINFGRDYIVKAPERAIGASRLAAGAGILETGQKLASGYNLQESLTAGKDTFIGWVEFPVLYGPLVGVMQRVAAMPFIKTAMVERGPWTDLKVSRENYTAVAEKVRATVEKANFDAGTRDSAQKLGEIILKREITNIFGREPTIIEFNKWKTSIVVPVAVQPQNNNLALPAP